VASIARDAVVEITCLLSNIVNTWNSLPNDVVEAETINTFKNRLDKH